MNGFPWLISGIDFLEATLSLPLFPTCTIRESILALTVEAFDPFRGSSRAEFFDFFQSRFHLMEMWLVVNFCQDQRNGSSVGPHQCGRNEMVRGSYQSKRKGGLQVSWERRKEIQSQLLILCQYRSQ